MGRFSSTSSKSSASGAFVVTFLSSPHSSLLHLDSHHHRHRRFTRSYLLCCIRSCLVPALLFFLFVASSWLLATFSVHPSAVQYPHYCPHSHTVLYLSYRLACPGCSTPGLIGYSTYTCLASTRSRPKATAADTILSNWLDPETPRPSRWLSLTSKRC